jgi:hypothetical protein
MADEKKEEQKEEQYMTLEELRKLPLRALVALCVRAAAKMKPHFDWLAKDTEHPERAVHPKSVESALEVAFDFANGAEIASDARPRANAAFYASAFSPGNRNGVPATAPALSAVIALTAAKNEGEEAVKHAIFMILAYGAALEAIRADYNRLLELNLGTFPELGKPIDARKESL